MLHKLKRHPVPMVAHLERALVLTYACEPAALTPVVSPGLELETWRGWAFFAVAMVRVRGMRPSGFPRCLGQDAVMCGYRLFTRLRRRGGRTLRGLRIVRSDIDNRWLARTGNLLTHYNFVHSAASMHVRDAQLHVSVTPSAGGSAGGAFGGALRVSADLSREHAGALPTTTVFADGREARRFAGPMPLTLDYEAQTGRIIVVRGDRGPWSPRLVNLTVDRCAFADDVARRTNSEVRLSAAWFIEDVPYRWRRGRLA